MKITGLATLAVMVGGSVWAGPTQVERQVTVCMSSTPNPAVENGARNLASDIFAGIGVKIRWHSPSNCPAEGIVISFSQDTPSGLLPGALAYSLPFEGTHIVVFYDRVENRPVSIVPRVLGHVITHEITHILQGVKRHSESGIMKATWTRIDYQQMFWEPLRFTDEDVMLIHSGLKARVDRSSQEAYR